jgi:hypothetical protein
MTSLISSERYQRAMLLLAAMRSCGVCAIHAGPRVCLIHAPDKPRCYIEVWADRIEEDRPAVVAVLRDTAMPRAEQPDGGPC